MAFQLLLDRGAGVAAENAEDVKALYWAARKGHATIVELLLKSGANCRSKDKIGWAPLHRAAFNEHITTVEIQA